MPNYVVETDHLAVTGTIVFSRVSKQIGRGTGTGKLPLSVRRYVSGLQTRWRQSACFGGVWTLLPCISHSHPPQRLLYVDRAAQIDSGQLLHDQPVGVTSPRYRRGHQSELSIRPKPPRHRSTNLHIWVRHTGCDYSITWDIIKPPHQTLGLTKWLTELRYSAKHEKVPVSKQRVYAPVLATMAHERILELLKSGVLKNWVHHEHQCGTKTTEEHGRPAGLHESCSSRKDTRALLW
jgi:hypothetical protein